MIKTKIIKQTIKSRLFTMNRSNTAFVYIKPFLPQLPPLMYFRRWKKQRSSRLSAHSDK